MPKLTILPSGISGLAEKTAVLLNLILAILLACPAFAQQSGDRKIEVKGYVYDQDRLPLAGASVVEKGTANGTTANARGHFSLVVSDSDAELEVSFIGMKTENVPVKGKSSFDIVLYEDRNMLDDVVVIGYGTVKKSDLTGSVSLFKGKDMDNRFVVSIEDALRGQVAGVSVTSNDGQPGESLNIRIRGTGSINASSAPLYVVDGVPMDELDISPEEVDHMEILKDASATAIYGSRGANGVVMITTKKGEKGKPQVNVSFKASAQQPVRLLEMMDSYDYNLYRMLQRRNVYRPGESIPDNRQSWPKYLDQYGNTWLFTPDNRWYVDHISGKYLQEGATDTDWQREMRRMAMTYDGRVRISGGSDKVTYSFIGTFFSQEGMVIESGYQKYGLRANIEVKVSKRLDMGFNFNASRAFQQGAYTNDVDGTMINMLGQQPVKAMNYTDQFEDVEGESALVNNNPWYQATHVVRNVSKDNVLGKIWLDYRFAKNFRLNISGSYAMGNVYNDQFYPDQVKLGQTTNGLIRQNRRTTYDWLNENILYYEPKSKGPHSWNVMAGITFQEKSERLLNTSGQNISYDALKEWGFNYILTPLVPTVDKVVTRMVSWLARANYTYDDRYLFTASVRADGSSRFGANHKWGYFPSGAFAWRISEEKFMKPVKFISDLKLRLSAGVSGNTAIPAYQTLNMGSASNYPMDGDTPSQGITIDRVANPSLKWETSTQYNAGIDLGLFYNRLTATVDVYLKQTRDLLLVEKVTGTSGYTSRWSNKGAIDNKGLEISLRGDILQNTAVKWSSSFNMSFNRSKVRYIGESGEMILDASGTVTDNFAILKEGMPVGLWYGYETDGLYRTFEEIDALPDDYVQFAKTKNDLGPGFQKYVDQNGDGVIDEGDRVVIGCAEPKFTGGWQNTLIWKDLRLDVNTEFSYGRQIFNATALFLERGVQTNNATARYRDNYWKPTLYDYNTGEVFIQGNEENSWLPGTPRDAAYGESYAKDLYIEDGSYFRISDISLSYQLPERWMRKIKTRSIRVIASVRNAWIWTKYSGYDPDVNSVSGDYADLIPGLDNGSYPRARVYTLGVNITF